MSRAIIPGVYRGAEINLRGPTVLLGKYRFLNPGERWVVKDLIHNTYSFWGIDKRWHDLSAEDQRLLEEGKIKRIRP